MYYTMMHCTIRALHYSMKRCGIYLFFSLLPSDFPKFAWSEVSRSITPSSLSYSLCYLAVLQTSRLSVQTHHHLNSERKSALKACLTWTGCVQTFYSASSLQAPFQKVQCEIINLWTTSVSHTADIISLFSLF